MWTRFRFHHHFEGFICWLLRRNRVLNLWFTVKSAKDDITLLEADKAALDFFMQRNIPQHSVIISKHEIDPHSLIRMRYRAAWNSRRKVENFYDHAISHGGFGEYRAMRYSDFQVMCIQGDKNEAEFAFVGEAQRIMNERGDKAALGDTEYWEQRGRDGGKQALKKALGEEDETEKSAE